MQIKDKVIIVTGASSGIGLATAKLLTKKGGKVALVARSKDKLQHISKSLHNSIAIQADMTRSEDIKSMVQEVSKRFGIIDVLINNAGQGYDAPVEKIDVATYSKTFYLNVVGPLIAMQQVIPQMRKQGEGSIINISSGTALMHIPGMSAYSSAKRALSGISLTAREELKASNINVSVVYPYITATDFEKNTIKSSEENGESGSVPYPADSAEYVACLILEAIENGKDEVFAHEWMDPKNR